ncbi:UNVERIFIED_CONTAM: MaoC dehydratase-like protein [Williamsia faeni]
MRIVEGANVTPEAPYEVTQAGIDQLVAVIGGPPATSGEAPPTFVNVVLGPAIKSFRDSGDRTFAGVVHTAESTNYTRLLRAGDVVNTSVTVTGVHVRPSVTQFEILSVVTDLDGQEIVRVSSSLICETEAAE